MPAYFGKPDRLLKSLRNQLKSGTFWADRKFDGDHLARLQNALAHLPLPGAFREAMIALRAMIRRHRKSGGDWAEELGLLYWLAAIKSYSMPYSERLQEPGFNVLATIPWGVLSALEFTYDQLGYEHLGLTKTDIAWLQEAFGKPSSHATLLDLHRSVWDEYEHKLIVSRGVAAMRFREELPKLLQ